MAANPFVPLQKPLCLWSALLSMSPQMISVEERLLIKYLSEYSTFHSSGVGKTKVERTIRVLRPNSA